MRRIVTGMAITLAVVAAVAFLPDLKRYIRISTM
jgi:hypothetical protein